MPSKTQRGRGRAIRSGAADMLFPSPQFINEHLNPTQGRAGLIELLRRLNYAVTDADEPGLAGTLASPGLNIKAARRIAQTHSLGRDVRVWAIEVDNLARITDANALIHKSRQFAGKYTYLLVVTDYQRFLWAYPQGQVVYKLWLDGRQAYHSDLKTLALLTLSSPQANWFEYLKSWREAFSVERVTEDFYRDYIEAQKQLQGAIEPRGLPDAEKFEYAQLLLGRLMFLYFLQKKDWLGREGQAKSSDGKLVPDPDYLQRKFEESCQKPGASDFYARFLQPLFLDVLCTPRRERSAALTRKFGEIPFLNGGLFHKSEIEKAHPDLKIPDAAFDPILNPESGLFRRYSFTVREDEPLDRQVAVDPEMLGKIFERQVVGREVKGAFYTPAPVVDYMCRESLKAYVLAHACGDGRTAIFDGGPPVARAAVLDLFEMTPAEETEGKTSRVARLSDAETLRLDTLLDGVTIIDPAVGSGAFPVGMLHQLVDLRTALVRRSPAVTRSRVRHLNEGSAGRRGARLGDVPADNQLRYVLKRRIIQRNLYGVDIESYAIQIAKLRLWLSLAVEHEVEFVDDIQPLPNLDFNLVIGNSLISTFRPPKSKEAFDLEMEIRSPRPGSRLAEIATDIERRTLNYADMENEEEKERERAEIEELHRQLLGEQLRQAVKDIPAQIKAIRSQYMFEGAESEGDNGRIAYLEHQAEVCDKALHALNDGHEIEGSSLPMLWALRFPRIFAEKKGFDLCIANPPYLSMQGSSDLDYIDDLKAKAGGNDDFYVFFSYRALGHPHEPERMLPITRPDGITCFITSDTYFTLSTKTDLRDLLQAKRLLKIGQVDPFRATVDAAIFLAQNRPRLDGEEVEFFQGRFVYSQDELSEMSDRAIPGQERWVREAEFTIPDQDCSQPNGPPGVCSLRDATLGFFDAERQQRGSIWRYRVDPLVWRAALEHAFFEPSKRNAALYNQSARSP